MGTTIITPRVNMNFGGFQDLMRRIARTWYERSKIQILEMDMVKAYLQDSPFTAKQSPENEIAYERLMDVRLKLVDLSFEIDKYHDSYMRFLTQTLNSPDLKNRIGKPLKKEERNLIDLELDIGKVEAESEWDKVQDMVVTLPNDQTKTIRISAETQKRSWFGLCPVSLKIGSLKMCGGCKMVGYFGKV